MLSRVSSCDDIISTLVALLLSAPLASAPLERTIIVRRLFPRCFVTNTYHFPIQAMNEFIPLFSSLIKQLNKMLDVTHHEFYDEKIVDTATALLTMVYLMDDAQFSSYLMNNLLEMSKKERILDMMECFQRLIKFNTVLFPHIWLVVQVFQTEVTVKLLEWSNVYMVGEFLAEKQAIDDRVLNGEQETAKLTEVNDLWDVYYDIGMKILMMDLLSYVKTKPASERTTATRSEVTILL